MSVTNVSVKSTLTQNKKTDPTQYIYGQLKEDLRLLREKKPRRFANSNHLKAYGKLYWAYDWKEYGNPATRQNDWDLFLVDIYSSARIADYIESTCRKGTGRGCRLSALHASIVRLE